MESLESMLPSANAPLLVSQDVTTSIQSWTNCGTTKNLTGNDVDELDWKSLEFLGLVEEYVSAVIKGEKMEVADAPLGRDAGDTLSPLASGSSDVSFSGVKALTPNPEKPSNTFYVMKNCPLGTGGERETSTFLPIGTSAFVSSPLAVDDPSPSIQNVTFTVREEVPTEQPSLNQFMQPKIEFFPQMYEQSSSLEENDKSSEELSYQVDYIINEELSRDGLSPNDSFESISLNLSMSDPSVEEHNENLYDLMIGQSSQLNPTNKQSPNSTPVRKEGPKKSRQNRNLAKSLPEESLPFPCESCGRRFVSLHSVKRHMAIHDLDRPWKCDVCGKAFKQQAHLYSHKFTHTGTKPFECTNCHKSFNVKSNLHRHEKEVCKVPAESRTPTRAK